MAGSRSAVSPAASAGTSAFRLAADSIERHRMLAPGDHVLVAFSGGADSTALAIVLKTLGYRVTLAHVDHGMRADSALDAFHCRSTAGRLGLDIELMKVAVDPPTEAEARRVRYEELEGMMTRAGADRIATGHTLNDEAETVRMRLERGGFGLGIPPMRGDIIRPLLCVGRRLTESVCREAGVLFLEDPSNQDLRFTRNRIRRELGRGPESDIARLVSLGALNRSRKMALDAAVAASSECLRIGHQPRLDRRALLAAPEAVARGLVRRALDAAGVEASGRHVEDILEKVALAPVSSLDLPGGVAVWTESIRETQGSGSGERGDWLVFGRRPEQKDLMLPEVPLNVPGFTSAAHWDLGVSVRVAREPDPDAFPPNGRKEGAGHEEIFDWATLPSGLALRQWRPGDRFQPLRSEAAGDGPGLTKRGTKKLQDFFVDSKVPRDERHRVPVLAAGDHIVWVVGHRIDNRYKLTLRTGQVARIRVAPLKADL